MASKFDPARHAVCAKHQEYLWVKCEALVHATKIVDAAIALLQQPRSKRALERLSEALLEAGEDV